MHRLTLTKPDGRLLNLYARQPLDPALLAPSPFPAPLGAAPHLRWHPLRGEWVTYAAYRQGRTYLPPPQWNPLAPMQDPAHPTELPAGDWEVAVFDNRFPALGPPTDPPGPLPHLPVPVRHAGGHCEVVVFTQDPQGSLSRLPPGHLELLLEVWSERCALLGALDGVQYVLPFENRGVEMGVTLHHPHGQIYAYPVLPPVPARMAEVATAHWQRHGTGPLTALLQAERADGSRLLYAGPHAVALVPPCARYPYEVWVAPWRPAARLADLDAAERSDLAHALQQVLRRYDALWDRPMPYLLTWYAAPVDGRHDAGWHLHAQLTPPLRSADRRKVLAGTELGAGLFAMDVLPEDSARALQAVELLP